MVSLRVVMWKLEGNQTIELGTWRWPVVPVAGDSVVLQGHSCRIRTVYHHLEGRYTPVTLYINHRPELEKWLEERELKPDLTDPLDEWEGELDARDAENATDDHQGGTA